MEGAPSHWTGTWHGSLLTRDMMSLRLQPPLPANPLMGQRRPRHGRPWSMATTHLSTGSHFPTPMCPDRRQLACRPPSPNPAVSCLLTWTAFPRTKPQQFTGTRHLPLLHLVWMAVSSRTKLQQRLPIFETGTRCTRDGDRSAVGIVVINPMILLTVPLGGHHRA